MLVARPYGDVKRFQDVARHMLTSIRAAERPRPPHTRNRTEKSQGHPL